MELKVTLLRCSIHSKENYARTEEEEPACYLIFCCNDDDILRIDMSTGTLLWFDALRAYVYNFSIFNTWTCTTHHSLLLYYREWAVSTCGIFLFPGGGKWCSMEWDVTPTTPGWIIFVWTIPLNLHLHFWQTCSHWSDFQKTVFIPYLHFTNGPGPRDARMEGGRVWQMRYLFISPVDFFYRFICFRSTLISFIYFFPFKSIPRHSSVVPPPAPQDYCGSNDTSRSSITGTIEWFKPFLVSDRASGELNVAYSADPIPVGVIASVTAFWRAGSNVLRTDFFWKVASACHNLFLFFVQCFIGLVLSFSFLASS